jgi:hypothetical protein
MHRIGAVVPHCSLMRHYKIETHLRPPSFCLQESLRSGIERMIDKQADSISTSSEQIIC